MKLLSVNVLFQKKSRSRERPRILSPLRLPFRHSGRICYLINIMIDTSVNFLTVIGWIDDCAMYCAT